MLDLVIPVGSSYNRPMNLIREKIDQAVELLDELDLDMWLLAVRETPVMADPTHALVVGIEVAWESFFVFTRKGDAVSLVGNFDEADFARSGNFTEVMSYTEGVSADFRKLISRLDPKSIGVNYSLEDPSSDGLTHGMFMQLQNHLKGTPYADRLVSAARLTSKLRARKTSGELALLERAAIEAEKVFGRLVPQLKVGLTEIEVAEIIDREIRACGGEPSFETICNAGDKTEPGHGSPTTAVMEPGDLMHIDFGVLLDGYCSDIQRLVYFKRPGESAAPPELTEAFNKVRDIITETGKITVPGKEGREIDAVAREMLIDDGYEPYQHALGHQLGRAVHDGGALLGPEWERYGKLPCIPIEKDNVFTLELEIMLPGIGCVGLEEDVVVTDTGARFLCPRQMELVVL